MSLRSIELPRNTGRFCVLGVTFPGKGGVDLTGFHFYVDSPTVFSRELDGATDAAFKLRNLCF